MWGKGDETAHGKEKGRREGKITVIRQIDESWSSIIDHQEDCDSSFFRDNNSGKTDFPTSFYRLL
jgi:hypothetical protein